MDDVEFARWESEEKRKYGLQSERTHFLRALACAGFVVVRGGWIVEDIEDARKLLEGKIPINYSTQEGGWIEVGYSKSVDKFVGIHEYRKRVLANPTFDNLQDALKWFESKRNELGEDW